MPNPIFQQLNLRQQELGLKRKQVDREHATFELDKRIKLMNAAGELSGDDTLPEELRWQAYNQQRKIWDSLMPNTPLPKLSQKDFFANKSIIRGFNKNITNVSKALSSNRINVQEAELLAGGHLKDALNVAEEKRAGALAPEKEAIFTSLKAEIARKRGTPEQQVAEKRFGLEERRVELAEEQAKAKKAPTKASIQGQVLQKFISGEKLNPQEQAVYQGMQKKGTNVRFNPDTGTFEVSIGGELSQPTPTFQTQIQKETDATVRGVQGFITMRDKITPEAFGVTSKLAKGMQEVSEFFSPGSTPKWAADITVKRDKLFRQTEQDFALWVKQLTGVQFGEKEATRLKKGYPNAEDNYAEFNNKFEDIFDSYIRSIARLKRFNNPTNPKIRSQIFNAVPLGVITLEEIETVKQDFGLTITGKSEELDPTTASQILQEAGGDKEMARELARQRGFKF